MELADQDVEELEPPSVGDPTAVHHRLRKNSLRLERRSRVQRGVTNAEGGICPHSVSSRMQNVMLVGSKVILQKLAGVRRQASQLTRGSEQVKVHA